MASGPSSRRVWRTWGSRSRSSWRSCSPGRRRCCPRRSTRWPTRSTRPCCCGAASARSGCPTRTTSSATAGRAFVYGFLVAIIIFLLGGLFSLYEGWEKFHNPEVPRDVWVAYTVLFISIGLETFSFRTAVREANKSRGSKSIPRYVRDSRQPELPVVLLEDFGALIGLGLRAGRHLPGQRDRRRALGRDGRSRDRHPAGRHRAVPVLQDGLDADRRVRAARGERAGPGGPGRAGRASSR